MTTQNNAKTDTLGTLVVSYLNTCQQARTVRYHIARQAYTERYRIAQQAKYLIHREKEHTNRIRIQANVEINREQEHTEREISRCAADIDIAREKRKAFESLCTALKDALRNGQISLENIRQQFGNICQLMIERDIPPTERAALFGLLSDLLGQQKEISAGNLKTIAQFQPQKYLTTSKGTS